MVWLIFGVICVVVVGWLSKSFRTVEPDEMAVLVIFGWPARVYNSGLRFVPWFPKIRLVMYPKKLYNLDYQTRKVITKAGRYPAEDPNAPEYGSQPILVDAVAYMRFPLPEDKVESDEPGEYGRKALVKILESQIPTDEEGLLKWTEDSVVGALRIALGQITWKQATEDIEAIRDAANTIFTQHDGAMARAGFNPDRIRLTVKEIHLPPKLEEEMAKVDTQRLEAKAAPFEAEQRAEETMGATIQMMAKATGRTPEAVQQEINGSDDLKREFQAYCQDLTTRRMSLDKNALVDIKVDGAEGPEKALLNILAAWRRMPTGGKEKGEKEEIEVPPF